MGHYASEMGSSNPEFHKLEREISKLKRRLENSPLSAFTVGDLPKIKALLKSSWSSFHVSPHMLAAMQNEIKEFKAFLAKVPK